MLLKIAHQEGCGLESELSRCEHSISVPFFFVEFDVGESDGSKVKDNAMGVGDVQINSDEDEQHATAEQPMLWAAVDSWMA